MFSQCHLFVHSEEKVPIRRLDPRELFLGSEQQHWRLERGAGWRLSLLSGDREQQQRCSRVTPTYHRQWRVGSGAPVYGFNACLNR